MAPALPLQALWSDPSDSDGVMANGVHLNDRDGQEGRIKLFGPDVTATFCKRERLQVTVKWHAHVHVIEPNTHANAQPSFYSCGFPCAITVQLKS